MIEQIKLGSRIFSELKNEKAGDWGAVHNRNKIYTEALSDNGIDKAQFDYDPEKKWFKFGKIISRETSSTDQGEEKKYNIYLKPFVVAEDGQVVTEGEDGDIVDNPTGDGSVTVLSLDNPDYAALLSMLEVMEVTYDDDPITIPISTSTEINSTMNDLSGIRIKWVNDTGTYNCLRIKNTNTNGNRYNGNVFLKVLKYDDISSNPDVNEDIGYGSEGDNIYTVSYNSVNFNENNIEGQYYEWYFPKSISFENGKIYVIIPHDDKSYSEVTNSDAKLIIPVANIVHSGSIGITGVWTSNRSNEIVSKTPVFEVCNKLPTSIKLKR